MGEQTQFRDAFSRETIAYIAERVYRCNPQFDREGFEESASKGFEALSFGPRARRIADTLAQFLPHEFPLAAELLVCSLGPLPEKDHLDGFDGFYIVPLTMYVSSQGIEYPDESLQALYEMTKRFSAESEIRPFLERYPAKTLLFLESLTKDPSPFARRLASEGTRPRLPLSGRIKAYQRDPAPILHLLDALHDDPNLMVRRSVANNLNDISKDNPDVAVETLRRWRKAAEAAGGVSDELEWLTRHSLRTLVKTNHQGALTLLGYATSGLLAQEFSLTPAKVSLGEAVVIRCTLRSTAETTQRLALNYAIAFLRGSGRRSRKVFRLPDRTLGPGESVVIEKTHKLLDFKNQTFAGGDQPVDFLANGTVLASGSFELTVP